jgi:hypothetical protein
MITITQGWYIQVARKGFMSIEWELRFFEGIRLIILESGRKEVVEGSAEALLAQI